MAGYQVGGACYTTPMAALQAKASEYVGSLVTAGSMAYQVDVALVTDTTIRYKFMPIDGSASFNRTNTYAVQPCNLMSTEDALELGWLIVAAWAGAYAIRFLTRTVRDHMGETNGDT